MKSYNLCEGEHAFRIAIGISALVILMLVGVAGATAGWNSTQVTNDIYSDDESVIIQRSNKELFITFNSGGGDRIAGLYSAVSINNGTNWSVPRFAINGGDDLGLIEDVNGRLVLLVNDAGIYSWISSDGGQTWSNKRKVTLTSVNYGVGSIIQAQNGYYYVSYSNTYPSDVYVTRSLDLSTWENPVQVSTGSNAEFDSSLLQTSDGKFYLAHNSYTDNAIVIAVSNDGQTWNTMHRIPTSVNAHMGINLIEIESKPVLFYGSLGNLYYSFLNGSTWDSPQKVFSPSPFGADAILLEDGSVGIAYTNDVNSQRDIFFTNLGKLNLSSPTPTGPKTLTVDDSGGAEYIRIQDAIDGASPGDIIEVYSGTYYENVNVTKELTLLGVDTGMSQPVVDADESGNGITLLVDGIALENFEVINSGWRGAGITVISSNNTISDNNVNANSNGIYLLNSRCNTISGNSANNNVVGILLLDSINNTITANNASNNDGGIRFKNSVNNIIAGNIAYNNFFIGMFITDFSNSNTIVSNNVSNNNFFGIVIADSCGNTVVTNYVSNNYNTGIFLSDSNNNTIAGNNIIFNKYGIDLSSSSSNFIYDNYLNNTNNAIDNGNNSWNITKIAGTNIIGGLWLGGNYWSDYNGFDVDGDRLGDTNIPYNSQGSIKNGGDYLPYTLKTTKSIPPLLPMYFYGNVTINGDPAPDNTTILAKIENEFKGSIIAKDGKYGETANSRFIINGNVNDEGNVVHFYIESIAANETIKWHSGDFTRLDLSFWTAAVITVDDSGGAEYIRIQDAIDAASPGDTIEVYSGTYYENVNVTKQLTLLGVDTGMGQPVVDADESGSAIVLSVDGTVLKGFKAVNSGYYWRGAGIMVISKNNTISNNNLSSNRKGIYLLHSI